MSEDTTIDNIPTDFSPALPPATSLVGEDQALNLHEMPLLGTGLSGTDNAGDSSVSGLQVTSSSALMDNDSTHDQAWVDAFWASTQTQNLEENRFQGDADFANDVGDNALPWQDFHASAQDASVSTDPVNHLVDQSISTPVPEWLHMDSLPDWFHPQTPVSQLAAQITQLASPNQPFSPVDLSKPIENVWGILVALESGKDPLTLSAALVRQLLADASKPG
jgi:hypothetical protein